MCPLCLTSLAVTVAATTGVGAAALAAATRFTKSLAPRQRDGARASTADERAGEAGGAR